MCHVEFSMFGRVKSGTINASQLFLQGSMAHVFSIFKLRIHACNKDKITTFYAENIWHLCCQILFHTAITISKTNVGSSSKSLNPNPANTLRPRNSFCFLLVSSHFVYPNFKRPIPSQKWILKHQVQHENHLPMYVRAPSITSSEPLPKRPENPSRATAVFAGRVHRGPRRDQLLDHGGMVVISRVMQGRRASEPRMRRGRRGSCGCRRETKR